MRVPNATQAAGHLDRRALHEFLAPKCSCRLSCTNQRLSPWWILPLQKYQPLESVTVTPSATWQGCIRYILTGYTQWSCFNLKLYHVNFEVFIQQFFYNSIQSWKKTQIDKCWWSSDETTIPLSPRGQENSAPQQVMIHEKRLPCQWRLLVAPQ